MQELDEVGYLAILQRAVAAPAQSLPPSRSGAGRRAIRSGGNSNQGVAIRYPHDPFGLNEQLEQLSPTPQSQPLSTIAMPICSSCSAPITE